jgi:hypothetical protein
VAYSFKQSFAASVYCIWQERNARIFAGKSKSPQLLFNQVEGFIRDKLDLVRNVPITQERIWIHQVWKLSNEVFWVDS